MRPKSVFVKYGGFVFGLILFIAVLSVIDHLDQSENLAGALAYVNPGWLALALVLQLGTYACNTFMWSATLRRARAAVSLGQLLELSVAKLFVDQVAPSGGLGGSLLVVESLVGRNVPRRTAIRALFIGLTGYYVAYGAFFIAALAYIRIFATVNRLVFWTSAVFGGLLLVFAALILLLWFYDLADRLPGKIKNWRPLAPFLDALREAPKHLSQNWTVLLEAALAAAGIFLLDALSLAAVLRSIHVSLAFGQVFASLLVSAAASTLIFVPGGLGVFEGSATAMLVLFRVPLGAALTATLIFRGLAFWLPMLPGLIITRRELRTDPAAADLLELK